jgi:uncharacterized membrane protein
MQKYQWSILAATLYLLIYVVMFSFGAPLQFMSAMFALSPVPVFIMVYQVLRNGTYMGKELEEGEEYGYADKKKEDLRFL